MNNLDRLRDNLIEFFSLDELESLCFDLGIDKDNIPGKNKGKEYFVRELLNYTRRREKISQLVNRCRQVRPKVEWGDNFREPAPSPKPGVKARRLRIYLPIVVAFAAVVIVLLGRFRTESEQYIVFSSYREGTGNIYLTNIAGTFIKRLTYNAGNNLFPACSPAGDRIAFTSDRTGKNHIYVMNTNGNNQQQVTFSSGNENFAAWSPDSGKLAYSSDRDGNSEIYQVELSSGKETRLTYNLANDIDPAWSPKGDRIAFASDSAGQTYQLYLMDIDGSNVLQLTNLEKGATRPAWSPDGTTIAFTGGKSNPQGEIYLINVANPSKITRLTVTATDEWASAWSPTGEFIAFNSREKGLEQIGNGEVFIMMRDGTNRRQITNSDNTSFDPSWCKDSARIR